MESDGSRISFFLVEPEDSMSQWRSGGPTPDCSPLDLLEHAFPEFDQGGILHGLEASRMHGEIPYQSGHTTALNQQLGNIDLTNHSKSVVPHMIPFSPSEDEERGLTFWEGSHGGSPNASHQALTGSAHDFVTPASRIFRPAHESLIRIETTLQPIDQPPLSGFSESTINSTPINSSCSEDSRGRDSMWSPYSVPQHRGRSLSVCSSPHAGSRRRSSFSDVYTMAENSLLDDLTPSAPYQHYLDIPRSGELPLDGYMYTGSDPSRDLQSFGSSCDHATTQDRPPPGGRYSQSLSPGRRHHQVQSHSPINGTRSVRRGSMSSAGSPIKPIIASDAVKRAAWKKRKNPEGKSFECDLCHEKLTTKQNLQYHTSAHLGIRDYACRKCNKRFTTPHVQKRHEKRCPDLQSASL